MVVITPPAAWAGPAVRRVEAAVRTAVAVSRRRIGENLVEG
jgi:hypothetical protein